MGEREGLRVPVLSSHACMHACSVSQLLYVCDAMRPDAMKVGGIWRGRWNRGWHAELEMEMELELELELKLKMELMNVVGLLEHVVLFHTCVCIYTYLYTYLPTNLYRYLPTKVLRLVCLLYVCTVAFMRGEFGFFLNLQTTHCRQFRNVFTPKSYIWQKCFTIRKSLNPSDCTCSFLRGCRAADGVVKVKSRLTLE